MGIGFLNSSSLEGDNKVLAVLVCDSPEYFNDAFDTFWH